MRVEVGKKLRVGPGDAVVIRGHLAPNGKIGRLFVFAREGDAEFSPYVQNVSAKMAVNGMPQIFTPMHRRLDLVRPKCEISFTSDIDGWIRVMQEVDRPNDIRAIVHISRTIDPTLPWIKKVVRQLREILQWNT